MVTKALCLSLSFSLGLCVVLKAWLQRHRQADHEFGVLGLIFNAGQKAILECAEPWSV